MEKQSFDSFLQETQEKERSNVPSVIKKAYQELKANHWEKVDELLPKIPKDCFEYYEISFFRKFWVSTYESFKQEVSIHVYGSDMFQILSSMISLCNPEKKEFLIKLYEDCKKDAEQYANYLNMREKLEELRSKGMWIECGELLEKAIQENPNNLNWYIYMATVKLKLDPSYDCHQEYMSFKKHCHRKTWKKDARSYCHCEYSHWLKTENIFTTLNNYSNRYRDLRLIFLNIPLGFLVGLKFLLLTAPVAMFMAVFMGIFHIYQLLISSEEKIFRRSLQKGKAVFFAQSFFIDHLEEAFFDYYPYEIYDFILPKEYFEIWKN